MHDLDRAGGIAALFLAGAYIFGFGLFFGAIDGTGYDGPAGSIAFISDHQTLLTLAMVVLYPLAGCALIVLSVAMHRRTEKEAEGLMLVATAFGLIWAGIVIASGMVSVVGMQTVIPMSAQYPDIAMSAWVAISVVQDALGGGIELVGGVWMAMVSWIAGKSGQIPRPLAWIGIVIGIVGVATLIPSLAMFVDVFGLGQIVWFFWLGVALLKSRSASISVDS